MGGLLFALIFIFVFYNVIKFISGIESEQVKKFEEDNKQIKEKRCPAHSWTYNSQDRLQCEWCNLKAGDISTNNGEY